MASFRLEITSFGPMLPVAEWGLENDPRYNAGCFEAFPFPEVAEPTAKWIAEAVETIQRHRSDALRRDARITMTGLYNVVAKLRAGEALSENERAINEQGACGVLRDQHDRLDALVAQAYGWGWPMEREEILSRLVTLHDQRVAEEKAGAVHWHRPEYQIQRFGNLVEVAQVLVPGAEGEQVAPETA